jgi:hypothetical protein
MSSKPELLYLSPVVPALAGNGPQRQCCENYIRTQKVTGNPFSGGDPEERRDELRLTHRVASG